MTSILGLLYNAIEAISRDGKCHTDEGSLCVTVSDECELGWRFLLRTRPLAQPQRQSSIRFLSAYTARVQRLPPWPRSYAEPAVHPQLRFFPG